MERIFGFDIGTTSIGFAVVDYDQAAEQGKVLRLGVRIFPEARDPKGTPLNQTRRQKRMMRRQLRRRRARRRALNESLTAAGLLPPFSSPEWNQVMSFDPFSLRARAFTEQLAPHEIGRALYHLAQRRHFKGRGLSGEAGEEAKEDKEAKSASEETSRALRETGLTLGAWLHSLPPGERRRGIHALRENVRTEFDKLWKAQASFHPSLLGETLRSEIESIIFTQRPVFWRLKTLGKCRYIPDSILCSRGSWISCQRRMLEKLNNLEIVNDGGRSLRPDERDAILGKLEIQESMSWSKVRAVLGPLFAARGEAGREKSLSFNLELGGESKLIGNPLEAKLAKIFGKEWHGCARRQKLREQIADLLQAADYLTIGKQRKVVLDPAEQERRRAQLANELQREFGITEEQAAKVSQIPIPSGWEPFSTEALRILLPKLEQGVRFGELTNGPEWEEWRQQHFPNRIRPTGEVLDRLPSPKNKEERERLAGIRNPTVVRCQNELRKVVNNLIAAYGKPDRIRVEMAREVGNSKRDREAQQAVIQRQKRRRETARKDLESNGIGEPSHDDIEKWLLWKEGGERCPYTGDPISFAALFAENQYQVEHIWPRSRSFDNSFGNKTLCRRDINLDKGNRTPFEYLGHDAEQWGALTRRLEGLVRGRGQDGMSLAKLKRFLAESMPEDFANRQLTDTSYASREVVAQLKRLWPDSGPSAPVWVQGVAGRVTAQLRRLWGLNNILASDGEKTRQDHRHHAIDALTVACVHPGLTAKLSRYWQLRDDSQASAPDLPAPWPSIRADAARIAGKIVVSHRVRKKASGALHKETTYGDTGVDFTTKNGTFRQFVTRKSVSGLTSAEIEADVSVDGNGIRDPSVARVIREWVGRHGGNTKRAFETFPRVDSVGPEIRSVRVLTKQQLKLMAKVSTGYADLGDQHHIEIFRKVGGTVGFEVVSGIEAARRVSRRTAIVRRRRSNDEVFLMSLAPGESIQIPAGEYSGIWVVTGVWASGQIVLERTTDAAHKTTYRPTVRSLLGKGVRKVAVDPIGRVRLAGD